MNLDIDIEHWSQADWPDLSARIAISVATVAPELANPRLTASILFTTDAEIHTLNREWRGRDKATNVLSFPMLARDELLELTAEGPPVMLGDLALAHETCRREAADQGVPLGDHAAHLILHGVLHLAGYDHETSPSEADAMEALEIAALAAMGIADPYGDRG